jgi:hypothetical protein
MPVPSTSAASAKPTARLRSTATPTSEAMATTASHADAVAAIRRLRFPKRRRPKIWPGCCVVFRLIMGALSGSMAADASVGAEYVA